MSIKIPNGPHFAILTEVSVTIPGDERSRTNPGHGYPESTETYINYEAFTDRDAWLRKIKEYETSRWSKKDYQALEVKPVTIETSVEVNVK